MKYYSLQEACAWLEATPTTLWRWMRKARIKPKRSPGDYRRHRISEANLLLLEKKHYRRAEHAQKEQSRLDDLEARIFVLEQEVKSLSKTVNTLISYSDPLGEEESPRRERRAAHTQIEEMLADLRRMQSKQAK